MTILITLTTAGANTGPFMIYTDVDGFTTPVFVTPVSLQDLLDGFSSSAFPEGTKIVRLVSVGLCENYIDIDVESIVTTTTTSSSTSSTTSTTTTIEPTTTTTTTSGLGTTTSTTTLPPGNMTIYNSTAGGVVTNVEDIDDNLVYPVLPGTTVNGTQFGAPVRIRVDVDLATAGCLCVYINSILFECRNVGTGISQQTFFTGEIFPIDVLDIYVTDGACV